MTGDAEDAATRRLRWRCRRGMKELDQLLVRYLDRCYAGADVAERTAFERLLECEDDRLWRWFLGREVPPDQELQGIVQRIVSLG